MNWRDLIKDETGVWHGLEAYVVERVAELKEACASTASTDLQIRQAQAAIEELRRLLDLPKQIKAETQARNSVGTRKEY